MYPRLTICLACLWLLAGSHALADPIIYESFTDYPDNALISTSPSGPALGLLGDWQLDSESFFYVNRTEADLAAGTGKAVYDFPYDDNGARVAFRTTSSDHVLFSNDGDVFFASFLIQPARVMGHMLFTMYLDRLDDGGQSDVSFGMKNGQFIVSNGGVAFEVSGGIPAVSEMLVVLRVEYSNNGNETVTLWVDPANESSDPVIDNAPLDLLNWGGGKLIAVSIRGEQMSGQPAFFDNLRVGLQFGDVTFDTGTQPPVLTRDAGMNGQFYDANNPGHGLDFNLHEQGFTVFYYGHTSTGERLWLVSELFQHDLRFGVPFELDMFEVTGGMFGQPATPETPWGTITINLAGCDSGHASFSGLDGNLEMHLVRLTRLAGVGCQY